MTSKLKSCNTFFCCFQVGNFVYNKVKVKVVLITINQTSWGRNKSRHMVECEVEYEQDGPIFIIRFEENSQQYVLKSKKSPTAVANDYLQKKCHNTCATILGIHVFGLNAKDVEWERNRKKDSLLLLNHLIY
ncbi:hypothetical protein C2G38_2044721 [Gigaspora rosea]|uniref:Uncharacterized protein n=1 Tax=Gigaspora rosea TaxID=44941 RepID=A0A397UH92_9GLOM|nr:hypothetical protein C2G38_2044721 [Gigaspora rosea]